MLSSTTKGAMHDWIHVDSFWRSSRDLAFPDKILQGVRGEKRQLKNLWIFLNKLSLDQGISLRFHRISQSKEQQLGKTISIFANNDFSILRRNIFRCRNLFI